MSKHAERTPGQICARILFVVYGCLMLWLLFGQRVGQPVNPDNVNLIPLATLKLYLRIVRSTKDAQLLRHAFINLAGNVVMFVPLGWFLPVIWKKYRNFFPCVLCLLLVILLVEGIQYLTGLGSCDVDDVILNVVGGILGCWLCRIFTKNRK